MKTTGVERIVLMLSTLGSFIFSLIFTNHNYYVLMNGDTSSELLLGRLLAKEGSVISGSWFYSTELRTIGPQTVYKYAFMLFGDNWKLVRMVSNAILLLILLASYYYMMYAMDQFLAGLYTGWIVILPFGQAYGYTVIYAQFYTAIISLCFISMGLIFKLYENYYSENRKKWIYAILVFVISVISGLSGVRQGMICFGPLFLSTVVIIAVKCRKEGITEIGPALKSEMTALKVSVFSIGCFCIGLFISIFVLSRAFKFRGQSFMWNSFSINAIVDTWNHFIACFGQVENVGVFGPYGIANLMSLLMMFLMVVSYIRLIVNYDKLPDKLRMYVVFIGINFAINSFLIGCCKCPTPVMYWIPVIVQFIPLFGWLFKYDGELWQRIGKTTILYVLMTIALTSLGTCLKPCDSRIKYAMDYSVFKKGADFLASSEYEDAYAPFWISNVMTEMTNGKIETWTVKDADDIAVNSPDFIKEWLQLRVHKEKLPEGRVAVVTYNPELLEKGKILDLEAFKRLSAQDEHIIYADDYLKIYGFDSMEDYYNFDITLK